MQLVTSFGVIFLIILSVGKLTFGAKIVRDSVQNGNQANVPVAEEDDDDFVPYQGQHFNIFDWNLFRTMSKKCSGNLLVSPISIKLALALLFEGAQDQSAYELANVLQLPVSRSATRDRFNHILRSLQAPDPRYLLDVSTRIYVDNSVLTRQRYEAIVKTFYDTDVLNVNLNETKQVADNINLWIQNITRGNINKLITDDQSLKDEVMLVINAIFFKGSWRRGYFSPNNTRMGSFQTNSNTTIQVPYINSIGRFYYAESTTLDAQILRIPYNGHKFAMYIILPRTTTGLNHILNEINPFLLTRHTWQMQDLPLEVSIPKFKLEFTSYMESILREMGIRDIFDNTATLTGIAKTKRASRHLIVSNIVQKTGIEVSENGTVAYVATDIHLGNKVADEIFNASRPFLFYIEDESEGTILYLGKMVNPLETSGTTGNMSEIQLPSRFSEAITEPPAAPAPAAGPTSLERYNFFNIDLLQAVNEEIEGNVVVSPASAKVALTSLVEGSKGRTKQELLSALRLPENVETIRSISARNLASLKHSENGTEIDVYTRFWTKQGLPVISSYNEVLLSAYATDIRVINFADPNNAANHINDWARIATHDRIKNFVDPNAISPDVPLMITSALYFKGSWLNSFDKKFTRMRCFYVPACQQTLMMENEGKYRYAHIPSLDAEVLELPYSNGRFSMLFLLPSQRENHQSLQILSRDLSYMPISVLLSSLEETEVLVWLPKFSIESKLDLKPALVGMGIRDMFEANADLSGITPGSIRIGSILQNAMIEIDEDGTTAAAVTGISVVPLMGSTKPAFRANRPFLFILVDLQSNGTIFAGRFLYPKTHETAPNVA
ncbi:uncharacterized protein [Prorops nasuta]|uniref:uncharacterized protein n=1 Tax=Prorops nasuta TaxID=863751 RepID=UPI0034CFB94E